MPTFRRDHALVTAAQPSGSVTFVFTDIEGSTRLLDELGVEAYREVLAEHRRVVREGLRPPRGVRGRLRGRCLLLRIRHRPGRRQGRDRGDGRARRRPHLDQGRDPHRRTGARPAEVRRARRLRLWSASVALHESCTAPLGPVLARIEAAMLAPLRSVCEEREFERFWEAGRSLTMPEAIDLASAEAGRVVAQAELEGVELRP
jgi:hypothetical protein